MGLPLKKTNPKGLERQKISTGFHSSDVLISWKTNREQRLKRYLTLTASVKAFAVWVFKAIIISVLLFEPSFPQTWKAVQNIKPKCDTII